METLKMHSLDGVQRNIELIGKLFPNAITEVKRDGKVEHAIDRGGPGRALPIYMAGQEKGNVGGKCAHHGNAASGGGRQFWQGWHTRRF